MTSTSDVSKTIERASVTQILADLLVLGHDRKLPDPIELRATADANLAIELTRFEELCSWHAALGGDPDHITTTGFRHLEGGTPVHTTVHRSWVEDRNGWCIRLRVLVESETAPVELVDADKLRTVA